MRWPRETEMVHIFVTQDDIDKGLMRDCWRCPIAMAVNRLLKSHWRAGVCGSWCEIYQKSPIGNISKRFHCSDLPPRATRFVRKTDRFEDGRSKAEPIDFWMELPKNCIR